MHASSLWHEISNGGSKPYPYSNDLAGQKTATVHIWQKPSELRNEIVEPLRSFLTPARTHADLRRTLGFVTHIGRHWRPSLTTASLPRVWKFNVGIANNERGLPRRLLLTSQHVLGSYRFPHGVKKRLLTMQRRKRCCLKNYFSLLLWRDDVDESSGWLSLNMRTKIVSLVENTWTFSEECCTTESFDTRVNFDAFHLLPSLTMKVNDELRPYLGLNCTRFTVLKKLFPVKSYFDGVSQCDTSCLSASQFICLVCRCLCET